MNQDEIGEDEYAENGENEVLDGLNRDSARRFDYALQGNENRENYENQAKLKDYGTNWFPICGVGAVCFPEQNVPMKFNEEERELYNRLVGSARANGFVVLFPLDIEECETLPYIATLSKVVQTNPQTLSMELVGVHRCKVLEHSPERFEAHVQLLPEIALPSLLPSHLPRYARSYSIQEKRNLVHRITGYPFNYLRDTTENLVEGCCEELKGMIGEEAVKRAKDRGLTYFSYFAAQQIFSNRKNEYDLLKEDTANTRIAAALKYCRVSIGRCSNCNTPIFRNENIMRLPDQTMTHVNAYGYVHKITLLSQITNYNRATLPSFEFTWFPDYAWIIIQCSNCDQHIGWEYISMTRVPQCFYGIQREGIKFQNDDEYENINSDEDTSENVSDEENQESD